MTRLFVALALLCAPAFAAEDFYKVDGPSVAGKPDPARLDRLFQRLAAAPDAARAKAIENEIWRIWLVAPDERAASRMNRNIKYRGYGEYWDSMDQLGHVIRRFPDYPEAYNQRSILHFLNEDYEKSLADCRRVLKLEPRHFGCLSGMAGILKKLGREDEARRTMRRALTIHPYLAARRLFPDLAVPTLRL